MENNITADELFGRVADVLDASPDLAGRLMHETLVLLCSEGLRDTRHAFGNLSSQVESLCRRYRVKPADIVAIQRMRRDSNAAHPLLAEDVVYDCRALSLFISAVFQTDVPAALVGRLPVMNRPREAARHIDYRYIRCTVQSWDDKTLQVTADQNGAEEPLTVDYTDTPDYIDLGYLRDLLHEGMQLNLLDCETRGSGVVVPRLVVVEPDYPRCSTRSGGCQHGPITNIPFWETSPAVPSTISSTMRPTRWRIPCGPTSGRKRWSMPPAPTSTPKS
jgi:DNA replication ATP-dependent helicase Dna2